MCHAVMGMPRRSRGGSSSGGRPRARCAPSIPRECAGLNNRSRNQKEREDHPKPGNRLAQGVFPRSGFDSARPWLGLCWESPEVRTVSSPLISAPPESPQTQFLHGFRGRTSSPTRRPRRAAGKADVQNVLRGPDRAAQTLERDIAQGIRFEIPPYFLDRFQAWVCLSIECFEFFRREPRTCSRIRFAAINSSRVGVSTP